MWLWASMTMAACSLCLLFWWFGRPFIRVGNAARAAQTLLALPVRLLWPWVDALAPVCRPFLSWRMRHRLDTLLRQAGAPAHWSAHHLCAFQCVLAFIVAVGIGLVLYRNLSSGVVVSLCLTGALLAAVLPIQRLRERILRRRLAMSRELPFLLDMVTLCVEAGLTLHGALQQAALHGPAGPLRDELHHTLADIRAGMPRQDALRLWARRCNLPGLHHFVAAIGQAGQSGMSLGAVLRAQADQRRNERFLRAEKLALEAPVKMMFPLIFCIFPGSFLIIAFPIMAKFLELAE